jgi:diguanylate cyclase (GGDEF)-like protein
VGWIIECITQEHDYALLIVAVLVCVAGSCLSVQVSRRIRTATARRRRVQLGLSGLLAGATIWSTHFIAMLAYDPGINHGYEPILTGVSFLVAVLGTYTANAAFTHNSSMVWTLLGGVVFGATVATMHYIGMLAYLIPSLISWDIPLKFVSIALGIALGAAAFHRIAYPVTRYCWLGGAVLLSLTIISTHLVGMSAISIELSPLMDVPPQAISDPVLGLLIFGVTAIILAVGFAALSIETTLEGEAMQKLTHSATHDYLTGIPNRQWLSKFFEAFPRKVAGHPTTHLAFYAIDLDRFKAINDLNGHAAGDLVLKAAADRLTAACRANEYVARTGGDEFVAIKVGLDTEAAVLEFAERLSTAFDAPIDEGGISCGSAAPLGSRRRYAMAMTLMI